MATAGRASAAVAATGSAGAADARLVVVRGVTISDTATVAGVFKLTVSDGSGKLEVLLSATADGAFTSPRLPGFCILLNCYDIVGVLVPAGGGVWRLKPRSAGDLRKL